MINKFKYLFQLVPRLVLYLSLLFLMHSCSTFDSAKIVQYNYQPSEFGLFETKVKILDDIDHLSRDMNVRVTDFQFKKFIECNEISKSENKKIIQVDFLSIKDNEILSIESKKTKCEFFIRYDIVEFKSDGRFIFHSRFPKNPKEKYSIFFDENFSLMKAVRSPVQTKYREFKNYQAFMLFDQQENDIKIKLHLDTGKSLEYYLQY
ncbi:hypothetical protein [Leptospira sp. GIMC2001]|uniref:hypothetical protein n=1 Tax=Leptospira sp. GIMC2001 TaxID=1513297 RepID=UPI00234BF6F3|nr:hypothetical protein [Leptospira sp. GIMC2001]WCL50440.1 hypothetical protein O4O04_06365 [Leptospira sp. GIMC2001]